MPAQTILSSALILIFAKKMTIINCSIQKCQCDGLSLGSYVRQVYNEMLPARRWDERLVDLGFWIVRVWLRLLGLGRKSEHGPEGIDLAARRLRREWWTGRLLIGALGLGREGVLLVGRVHGFGFRLVKQSSVFSSVFSSLSAR